MSTAPHRRTSEGVITALPAQPEGQKAFAAAILNLNSMRGEPKRFDGQASSEEGDTHV